MIRLFRLRPLQAAFLVLAIISAPGFSVSADETPQIPYGQSVTVKGVVATRLFWKEDGDSVQGYILLPYALGKPFGTDWGASVAEKWIAIGFPTKISLKDVGTYMGLAGKLLHDKDSIGFSCTAISVDQVGYQEALKSSKVPGRKGITFSTGGCNEDGAKPFDMEENKAMINIFYWAKQHHVVYEQNSTGDDCGFTLWGEDAVKHMKLEHGLTSQEVIRDCEIFFKIERPEGGPGGDKQVIWLSATENRIRQRPAIAM